MNNSNVNLIQEIRVIHWNANGLRGQITELEDFLSKYNIHVALISETHLKPKLKIQIKGYKL